MVKIKREKENRYYSILYYFVVSDKISNSQKFEINRQKSNLYATKNYSLRETLITQLFPKDYVFEYYITKIIVNQKIIGTKQGCETFLEYNCENEPIMITDTTHRSVNQIKILDEYGPKKTMFSNDEIKIGVFCVEEDKEKLKKYLNLVVNGTNSLSKEIIPQYKGFTTTFGKKINFLFDALPPFSANNTRIQQMDFSDFANFCIRGIKKMNDEHQVDISLIYIGKNLAKFRSFDNLDLHDSIKVQCANTYKTQFLEEKTLDSYDDINKKIFNMSIALYTKVIGMPWYPETYSKDTLFLGISFGTDQNGVTVGCSQMFDGAGRGLQLIITKISDKHRKNQYLSEQEAYDLGGIIRSTYYRTSKIDELKRIVIHRCSPFREEEIKGFRRAFEGIDDFDLIQIIEHTSFNTYQFKNNICQGYPVKRGTTIKASKDNAYVWTDGSINDIDILNGKTYRNNKRGMGRPIKIRKHYGKISINETVRDLMFLTKMDFNSSDVIYSKLPVTIKYSRIVCDLLKQGNFEDSLISFEYIM